MQFRIAVRFLLPLVLVVLGCTSVKAERLERLYLKGEAVPVKQRAEVKRSKVKLQSRALKNRRFIISTPDGRILIARKKNSLGKLSKVASNLTNINARGFSGTVRSGGHSDANDTFALSLVSDNGSPVIHAVFHRDSDAYTVSRGDGETIVSQTNTPALPGCAGAPEGKHSHDEPGGQGGNGQGQGGNSGAAADGSVQIDVAVLLTPEYLTAAGGLSAAVAEANTAITTSNTAYNNSQISQQLNLVYAGATSTAESGSFDTDLTRVTTGSDGFYDEAQTIRETYNADLVSLLVVNTEYCGLAWLMTSVSSGFEVNGFSVVSRVCASANYSFPHELGHNMGANHDIANAGGSGAYSYSYGWRFTGTNAVQYRSVMAYAPGTRIGYFSNPDVSYQGTATGTSSANNALTLNNTASTIAAFRDGSGGSVTPTPTPEGGGQSPPPSATATPTPSPRLTKLTKTATSKACVAKGVVVDSVSSAKLAGQTVSLVKANNAIVKNARTNASGKFTLNGKLNTKYYLVAGDSFSSFFKCKSSRR